LQATIDVKAMNAGMKRSTAVTVGVADVRFSGVILLLSPMREAMPDIRSGQLLTTVTV